MQQLIQPFRCKKWNCITSEIVCDLPAACLEEVATPARCINAHDAWLANTRQLSIQTTSPFLKTLRLFYSTLGEESLVVPQALIGELQIFINFICLWHFKLRRGERYDVIQIYDEIVELKFALHKTIKTKRITIVGLYRK